MANRGELILLEKAYVKAKADDTDVVVWQFQQYDEWTKRLDKSVYLPVAAVHRVRAMGKKA